MKIDLSKACAIILNYNNFELTEKCVNSLLSISDLLRIVIVDNCSPNDSYNYLVNRFREERVHIIKTEENLGYASGNNTGVLYVKQFLSDVIYCFIINPDVIVLNSQTLESVISVLNSNELVGCVTVNTILNGKLNYPNESAWHYLSKSELIWGYSIFKKDSDKYKSLNLINNYAYVDVVQGCFFGFRIDDFIRVGLFDSNTFLYSEEIILSKKYKSIGKINAIIPFEYIYHNHDNKNRELKNKKKKIFNTKCAYNSRIYYIKNYSEYSKIFCFFATIFLKIEKNIKLLLYCFFMR